MSFRFRQLRMSLAALLLLSALAPILAQQPAKPTQPAKPPAPAQNPADPRADQHPGGPPPRLPFLPHRHIEAPTGEIPKPGQVVNFDASALGTPLALDHNWRLGIQSGTDPSKPDFDDSAWPIRDAKDALAEINTPEDDKDQDETPEAPNAPKPPDAPNSSSAKTGNYDSTHPHHGRPFAWFRIHVQLPPHHGPLALYVRLPITRNSNVAVGSQSIWMDVYANGQAITPEGPNGARLEQYQQISRIYPIDVPDSVTSLVIAVRMPYFNFGINSYTAFFANRTFVLGQKADLVDHLALWQHGMLFERLPTAVDNGMKFVLGIFLLALFWTQRDRREYLWLALHLITIAPLCCLDIAGSNGLIESGKMAAGIFSLLLLGAYFYFEFLIAFLALRRRWYSQLMRWTSPVLLTPAPLLFYIHNGTWIEICLAISIFLVFLWMIAWLLFVGLTLTAGVFRRNYEAALLLLPLLLSVVGMVELASMTAVSSWSTGPVSSPLTFAAGPIPIHFSAIADFAGVLAIIVIIFIRFQRIHRDRERASSELAAARSVQELMIPREAPLTPGFHVDTVYNPAAEVGGDFFHIDSTPEGGLLIVIGDVAGKGLQAAMNVSMLMGALRRTPQTDPAQLLSVLNQVLVGTGSLTTCEAAWFSPTGELVLASAGHPAPYLNSQEVQMQGGLPLGVIPEVEYENVRLYLHPGDRLLLFSDGVIEARRPNGELFGFDRLHNLSNQSAFYIADAAKDFGQEDDITVLTVRRLDTSSAGADMAAQLSAARGTGSLRPHHHAEHP